MKAKWFSEEQMELVEAAVDERPIETAPVEQEPVAEVELDAEAVPEPEADVEPVEAEAGVEPVAAEGEETPTAEEAVATEPEPALPDRLAILEEDEQVPTFDGEPIKDSIGWLPVKPEEDYYSGWSTEEEVEQEPEFERPEPATQGNCPLTVIGDLGLAEGLEVIRTDAEGANLRLGVRKELN